jgi:hypothetical protein
MPITHYHSSSQGSVEIESMHSAHLRMAAAKIRSQSGPAELADHMDSVAHRKEREWHDGSPELYAAWAAKNPQKHADFQARHFPAKEEA